MNEVKNKFMGHPVSVSISLLVILSLIPSFTVNNYGFSNAIIYVFLIFVFVFFSLAINLKNLKPEKIIGLPFILFVLIFASFLISIDKNFYFKGYKFLTLIPIFIFANDLSSSFSFKKILNIFYTILSIYILITAAYALNIDVSKVYLPFTTGTFQRYLFTDSITNHSINCLIYIFLTFSFYKITNSNFKKSFYIIAILIALIMIFLSASRQVLIAIFLFYILSFLFKKEKKIKDIAIIFLTFFILFVIFYIFSTFIDDSLYIRIIENPVEYTSGRISAIQFWYSQFKEYGTLGFGYVVHNSDYYGVSAPHNEFIRFYVEGYIFGLLFLIILFFHLVKYVISIANSKLDNQLKMLSILLLSIILTQTLVNNIFNDIYRLFIYVLFILMIYKSNFLKYEKKNNAYKK